MCISVDVVIKSQIMSYANDEGVVKLSIFSAIDDIK